jgi:hypothetical protein
MTTNQLLNFFLRLMEKFKRRYKYYCRQKQKYLLTDPDKAAYADHMFVLMFRAQVRCYYARDLLKANRRAKYAQKS